MKKLHKVAKSLVPVFEELRRDAIYGLVCIGNFAFSGKEWSVTSTKGDRGPRTAKELTSYLAVATSMLHNIRPTDLLCASTQSTSHLTFILGEELLEADAESPKQWNEEQRRLRRGIVTLVTALLREQHVRWSMAEGTLRQRIAEHLNLDATTPDGNDMVNYVERELVSRGVVLVLPTSIAEPSGLPAVNAQRSENRDGIALLDYQTAVRCCGALMTPAVMEALSASERALIRERGATAVDYGTLQPFFNELEQGLLLGETMPALMDSIFPLVGGDQSNLAELYAVMGFGVALRAEPALLAPPLFFHPMPDFLIQYVSFLLGLYGDGVGRKYTLSAPTPALCARLQTKLIPFSHAPSSDLSHSVLNFRDASFIVAERSRLKWGLVLSRSVKDAIIAAAGASVRGIVKMEGAHLYVVLTCQKLGNSAGTSAASDATAAVTEKVCRDILDAIHGELVMLGGREFRGNELSFQDLTFSGSVKKRKALVEGVQRILSTEVRDGRLRREDVELQQRIVCGLTDGVATVIEDAIRAFPAELLHPSILEA